jgi:hypothetical protein
VLGKIFRKPHSSPQLGSTQRRHFFAYAQAISPGGISSRGVNLFITADWHQPAASTHGVNEMQAKQRNFLSVPPSNPGCAGNFQALRLPLAGRGQLRFMPVKPHRSAAIRIGLDCAYCR